MQTAIEYHAKSSPVRPVGARVLLLSDAEDGRTADRLAGFGSHVDVEVTLDLALARLSRDPMGYDLFVMDCDSYGGMSGGELAVSSLIAAEARMRVMLVSRDFDKPAFPFGRRTAVCLPSEVGDEDFRRGFDHVLRDRLPTAVM